MDVVAVRSVLTSYSSRWTKFECFFHVKSLWLKCKIVESAGVVCLGSTCSDATDDMPKEPCEMEEAAVTSCTVWRSQKSVLLR